MARTPYATTKRPQKKKVLWVKFGWSEYYRGGPVDGNFGWLKDIKDGKDKGRGHEAFNFMPTADGVFYCYVPPQAKNHAPWNDDDTGWTVVCLAKNPQYRGIHIVGWYENATLLGGWEAPPADHPAAKLSKGGSAYDWSYCITSKSAYFIPPEARTSPFSHPSIRQGKYSFLVGPCIAADPKKEGILTLLETRLADLRGVAVHNPTEESAPDPELDAVDPLIGFGTPEHRRKVEKAAEKAVINHYKDEGFQVRDCTKLNCGYDFSFKKGENLFDVEIKGTASEAMSFFLTRNEHDAGLAENINWRLALVTAALSDKPKMQVFDAKQLRKAFDLMPYVYLGKAVVESEEH